jgi:hypothetical protein
MRSTRIKGPALTARALATRTGGDNVFVPWGSGPWQSAGVPPACWHPLAR